MERTTLFSRMIGTILVLHLLVTAGAASDIMFRYDAAHSGNFTPVAGVTGTRATQLWNFTTGNGVYSSPAVADGVVYVGGYDGNMYALNAANGVKLWNYSTGRQGVYSGPAVVNGIVYFGCDDHNMYALWAANGAKIWNFTTRSVIYSSPAVADGVVYFGSYDHDIYALDAATGAKIWNYTTRDILSTSPAVSGGVVYAGSWDRNLYAINAATGSKIWNFTTGAMLSCTPSVAGNIVYFGANDHNVYALWTANGAKLWNFTTGDDVRPGVAVVNSVVYASSSDGNVYALNAINGTKRWNFTRPPPSDEESSVAVANGIVYVGSDNGNLYALNAATGAKIWNYTTGGGIRSSPAVVNGVVYVGSYDNKVYALNTRNPPKADFTAAPRNGTAPLTVRFTDQSAGSPTSWKWYFGDGSAENSTQRNPVHRFAAAGTYNVTLRATNAFGNGSVTKSRFITVTFPAPSVNAIQPAGGIRGTLVTVTNLSGTGFRAGAKVFFNTSGSSITATNVTVISPRRISCTARIPAGAILGPWNVTVRNTDGKTGTKANAFLVKAPAAPTVTALVPGSAARGRLVWITNLAGTGFVGTPSPKVQLLKSTAILNATNVSVHSAQKITCSFFLPGGAATGGWNVRVTNGDGQSGVRAGAFTVL